MARKKATKPAPATVPVEALTHPTANRLNIPTRETAAFSGDDIGRAIYERDPALDPQLVWKTKHADATFEVPSLPIYVQEKVHPRVIIEDLKDRVRLARPADNLFADFNGLDDLQKKLEFYQHAQHWTNRLILGDSLFVMTSLAEKERLRGQVQCIYFDPPYGIKFGSNWQVSTRKRDVKDAKAEDLCRQPEQIKAFRDTWELGIHSYLTYLRDRLTAARELLTESGSIFVQIGDENVHLVRCLMDEVFGAENHIVTINLKKKGNQKGELLEAITDYILFYAKDREQVKYRKLFKKRPDSELGYVSDQLTSGGLRTSQNYDYKVNGKAFRPAVGNCWKILEAGMKRVEIAGRLLVGPGQLRFKKLDSDFGFTPITNNWDEFGGATDAIYVVQTSPNVIERCLLMTTDPGDLVLDPTCGSGTTAYVAEQWGRRWITIDTSRVALALARTRLMAARFPYYLLADSPDGRKKLRELTGTTPVADAPGSPGQPDIHRGFVYKTVPHVTLKSIANNPDIQAGMTRDQIDAAIRKHAETETLYDQPYDDKGTVRVCGPFTVESLSPHREMPIGEPGTSATGVATGANANTPVANAPGSPGNYIQTIIANLLKTGVKGTTKDQRITFTRLDPFPGNYIQAEGVSDMNPQ